MSTAAGQLPGLDDRLVTPETRYEMLDGKLRYVSPADPPHAARHTELAAALFAHAAEGYVAATDMLTRTSLTDDIAPDGSVYPAGPDSVTGGRRLEELAFEVVSTQSMAYAAKKAAKLAARGVRRVFAISVPRQRVYEWSPRKKVWTALPASSEIEDRVFVIPLRVEALLSAAATDEAVCRAFLAKEHPVLVEAVSEGERRGHIKALLRLLECRFGPIPPMVVERVRSLTEEEANSWIALAASAASLHEVLK